MNKKTNLAMKFGSKTLNKIEKQDLGLLKYKTIVQIFILDSSRKKNKNNWAYSC